NYCTGETLPDENCTDDAGWWGDAQAIQYPTHATHYRGCGGGTFNGWSGCAAAAAVPCGQAVNNTCTDVAHGLHSNYCGYTGTGFDAGQCNANRPSYACNAPSRDNCGNAGCGNGLSCGTDNNDPSKAPSVASK